MRKDEAIQHGLGYAAGREDASGVKTAEPDDRSGFVAFAHAYAGAWDAYNRQERFMMVNCRDAYETWQVTAGATIFRDDVLDMRAGPRDHACAGTWQYRGQNAGGHEIYACDGTRGHYGIYAHAYTDHVCAPACATLRVVKCAPTVPGETSDDPAASYQDSPCGDH